MIYELFGAGAYKYEKALVPWWSHVPWKFECGKGLVPIGFGARSACHSLVDVQVLLLPTLFVSAHLEQRLSFPMFALFWTHTVPTGNAQATS